MEACRASVIVATYNWPEALAVCLGSLLHQDVGGFEIVVADDGSAPATAQGIAALARGAPVPVRHVWQPDDGFHAAAARNKGILAARGEYLIFLDGDCLVLPDFVRTHLALAEGGYLVSGRRSWLRPALTQSLLTDPQAPRPRGRWAWFGRALANQCTRPIQFLHLPMQRLRYFQARRWRGVQTCNLGVWRTDAMRVNGFDERYRGHGGEDADFVIRLLRAGVARKRGDYASIVLHLDHLKRPLGLDNVGLFEDVQVAADYRAGVGLDRYGAD
jgi:glycosyltransferase involved in cell wall biosynthesis